VVFVGGHGQLGWNLFRTIDLVSFILLSRVIAKDGSMPRVSQSETTWREERDKWAKREGRVESCRCQQASWLTSGNGWSLVECCTNTI